STRVIPFVAIDESKIAPLHPYGVCVAIAFFVWDHVLMKMAVRRGFDRADFRVLTFWLGVLGWTFAWGVDAIFYHSGQAHGSRFSVQGLSSTGAIVGATLGVLVWTRIYIRKESTGWRATRRETPVALLPVSEVILATWPTAFALGRLGCALIHDHVGKAVAPGTLGSLFAIGFPRAEGDGVHRVFGPLHVITGASDVRYDLGLIELLVLAPLAIGFALTWKKKVAMGIYTIVASLVYGPIRFVLDFLRAEDGVTGEARQGGLTFAQYWSLAVIALGVVLLVRQRRQAQTEQTAAPTEASLPSAD
ncbi:MAG: Prolipoprotein diacylglyceryl transferase, partial [Labilithrix sp.]|nr:Prolipoprotein diacylglyceryl transferase [Labilithrix sp.]